MGLKEKLETEVVLRKYRFETRPPDWRCLSCKAPDVPVWEFRWRKHVGRSPEHHVRAEHSSFHPLCGQCVDVLRRRRRWFWPMRYCGGVAFAIAMAGVVTVPILFATMHLGPEERRETIQAGVLASVLLPLALCLLAVARRYSVPLQLVEFTGRGWECVAVYEPPVPECRLANAEARSGIVPAGNGEITFKDACAIADKYLKTHLNKYLALGNCQEESFGWVFSYDDRRYFQSGIDWYRLDGNLPFIVLRSNGEIQHLPVGKTFEESIAALHRSLSKRVD